MMKEIDVASISLVASNQNPLWNKYSSRADSWSSAKGRTLPIDPESLIFSRHRFFRPAGHASSAHPTLKHRWILRNYNSSYKFMDIWIFFKAENENREDLG